MSIFLAITGLCGALVYPKCPCYVPKMPTFMYPECLHDMYPKCLHKRYVPKMPPQDRRYRYVPKMPLRHGE